MQSHVLSAQKALYAAQTETQQLRQQLADRAKSKQPDDDLDFAQDGGFYGRKSER